MKNWKTTLCGIIGSLAAIPQLAVNILSDPNAVATISSIVPPKYSNIIAAASIIAGLLFAKDHNVTGGSVDQTKK